LSAHWYFLLGNKSYQSYGVYDPTGFGYPGSRVNSNLFMLYNGTIVLFGGYGLGIDSPEYLNDFWRLSTCVTCVLARWYYVNFSSDEPNNFPMSRSEYSLSQMSNLSLILYGGNNGTNLLSDIWLIDICYCRYGYCDPELNCICFTNFTGEHCTKRCIDNKCKVNCDCNDIVNCSVYAECDDNIVILNLTANLTSIYYIQGYTYIEGSNLNLSSFQFNIQQNLTLNNASIFFDDSSYLSVNGCIYINNISITVDLSTYSPESDDRRILLNSASGCLIGDEPNITFINKPNCTYVESLKDDYSISFIFENNCPSSLVLAPWEIAAIVFGSIALLIIVFVLVVLLVPCIREAIFPYNMRNKVKKVPQ